MPRKPVVLTQHMVDFNQYLQAAAMAQQEMER
jgi:hypothetical protein